MPLTEQQQLVFETLHARPLKSGTCFVVNEPGLRLISSNHSFLPAIKAALLEAAQDKNRRKLHGLDYVIGAFLVLGTKYAPDTLIPFIQSLPQPFIKEVVANIPVFFHKMKKSGNYNFAVAPAQQLVGFVKELARNENPTMQKAAQRVLKMI